MSLHATAAERPRDRIGPLSMRLRRNTTRPSSGLDLQHTGHLPTAESSVTPTSIVSPHGGSET
eukprot:130996-Rhodomonas_salina.4